MYQKSYLRGQRVIFRNANVMLRLYIRKLQPSSWDFVARLILIKIRIFIEAG